MSETRRKKSQVMAFTHEGKHEQGKTGRKMRQEGTYMRALGLMAGLLDCSSHEV